MAKVRVLSILAIATLVMGSTCAHGDVVHLKNGKTLVGDVKREEDQYVVYQTDGVIHRVQADQVVRIELVPTTQPAARDGDLKLASLRRSLEFVTDPAKAIDRYRSFIETHHDQPAGRDAEKDLSIWQERLDKHLVKWQSGWVSQDEWAALVKGAEAALNVARDALLQNRLKDAQAGVVSVLVLQPDHPGALYLYGVIQYRQEAKLVDARRAFEQANASLPNHAPTLNNLAVISWRQNQQGQALNFYDQALACSDLDRAILDNVAEVLHVLSPAMRSSPIAKRLARRAAEQEPRLVALMAEGGWTRWGGTWVNDRQLDEAKKARSRIEAKLDDLKKDFDDIAERIQKIDDDIEDNTRVMKRLEANRFVQGSDGRTYKAALPTVYYDLKRDNEKLDQRRRDLARELSAIRDAAQKLKGELHEDGVYTGIQQLIGAEGMPQFATDDPAPLDAQPAPGDGRSPATTQAAGDSPPPTGPTERGPATTQPIVATRPSDVDTAATTTPTTGPDAR